MKNKQASFTPKPICDWTKKSEYFFKKDTSLKQWAWEFLRRNPSYQEDCTTLRAINEEALARGEDEDEYMRVYTPPKQDGEAEHDWIIRNGGACSSWPVGVWYANKWKLANGYLHDPFAKFGVPKFNSSPSAVTYFKLDEKFTARDATGSILNNAHRAIGFDVSMPIEPQIKAAHLELIKQQKRLIDIGVIKEWPYKNATIQSYPKYLRMLDALLSNITDEDKLAEVIIGKKKEDGGYNPGNTIRKSIEAAVKIRDDGYWAIPMLGKKQR